jgi:phosphoglycolate phosphatase-like HAD superfamily hydrolase
MKTLLALTGLLTITSCASLSGDSSSSLASWNDSASRDAIVEFVDQVTDPGSASYVPPAERIAVFDNDGTLWCEQPVYFQLAYAMDRIAAMAPRHPEWKTTSPYKEVLEGDVNAALAGGMESIGKILAVTHAGMTTAEFATTVSEWMETARNPKFDRRYRELTYLPMVELLAYLRANEFQTFIVSGGGVDFMRAFTEEAYGIPPQQVVGSSGKTTYELRKGSPVLVKQPELEFVDDKEGKPVGINRFIGRRPILACGNSDGDYQMIEYTTVNNPKPSLGLLVHHTDDEREVAYDRDSHIGKLERGLDDAPTRGWVVIDMQRDWKTVFAGE